MTETLSILIGGGILIAIHEVHSRYNGRAKALYKMNQAIEQIQQQAQEQHQIRTDLAKNTDINPKRV